MAGQAFRRVQDAGSEQWFAGSGPPRYPGRGRWKPPVLPSMRMEDILEQLAYKYFNWRCVWLYCPLSLSYTHTHTPHTQREKERERERDRQIERDREREREAGM
jgi:hypothetical protein